jgi:mono/diheme cytochrome c family protein
MTVRTALKWTGAALAVAAVAAFLAFLYFIPPFLTAAPETFSAPMKTAPDVSSIADPAVRAVAVRGRQIVMRSGCIGCHATNGSQGPDLTKYLAGGALKFESAHGTFVSRNLTPDPETGLGKKSDEDIKRILRSGVFADGHVVPYTTMPWADFANLTEEDLYAVVVYLRHLPAVRHQIPDPDFTPAIDEAGVIERGYGGKDYGLTPPVPAQ